MFKSLALVLAGAAGALTLVVACSDDSPGDADAAACDCDPAEPPLAGRITRVEDRRTESGAVLGGTSSCADGATILGGGCYTDGPSPTLRLVEAGSQEAGPLSYSCTWNNETLEQRTTVTWVTCLNPAP